MTTEYNPKAYYTFKDSEGNILFTARGDEDPIIEESITKGLPISVDNNGNRYIYPYAEVVNGELILHFPSWFKETGAYIEWRTVWEPTLPYSTFDTETMNAINSTLKKLGKRGAVEYLALESYDTTVVKTDYEPIRSQGPPIQIDPMYVGIILVSIVIITSIAIWFTKSVKAKIKRHDEFSGIGWALVNAVVGLGIVGFISVIIAYRSINKELTKIRDRRYRKYAKRQLKDFVITYSICFVIKIIVIVVIYVIRYIN